MRSAKEVRSEGNEMRWRRMWGLLQVDRKHRRKVGVNQDGVKENLVRLRRKVEIIKALAMVMERKCARKRGTNDYDYRQIEP